MDEAPTPNRLSGLSPVERKAALKALAQRQHEEKVQKAKDLSAKYEKVTHPYEEIENPATAEERIHNRKVRQQRADDELAQICRDEAKFPVRLGNLLGPEGNVFNVIPAVAKGIRWAEEQGVYMPEDAYDIVRHYRKRTYDQTLRLIEQYGLDLDGSIDSYYASEQGQKGADDIRWGDNPIGGLLRGY